MDCLIAPAVVVAEFRDGGGSAGAHVPRELYAVVEKRSQGRLELGLCVVRHDLAGQGVISGQLPEVLSVRLRSIEAVVGPRNDCRDQLSLPAGKS